MTASPYNEPLSALRENTENLATWIAIWEARQEPDAFARRCASDAVDAIDGALRDLYLVRGRLTAETRQATTPPRPVLDPTLQLRAEPCASNSPAWSGDAPE